MPAFFALGHFRLVLFLKSAKAKAEWPALSSVSIPLNSLLAQHAYPDASRAATVLVLRAEFYFYI